MFNLVEVQEKLNTVISEIETNFRMAGNKELIMLIGNSGAGKSTLTNYLLGHSFLIEKNKRTQQVELRLRLPAGDAIPLTDERCNQILPATIGTTATEETLSPAIYHAEALLIGDSPGLCGNSGPSRRLVNGIALDLAVRAAKNVKAMYLVIPYPTFANMHDCDPRCAQVLNMLEAIRGLVENPDDIANSNIKFIFTKVPKKMFDIVPALKEDIATKYVPRIVKHYNEIEEREKEALDAQIKSQKLKPLNFFGNIDPKNNFLGYIMKIRADNKTPQNIRDAIDFYAKRHFERTIQLALLAQMTIPENLFLPDITDNGQSREELLNDFSEKVWDHRKLSFTRGLEERERVDQLVVSQAAESTNEIKEYVNYLSKEKSILASIEQLREDITSCNKKINKYLENNIEDLIIALKTDKSNKERLLRQSKEKKVALKMEINTLSIAINELRSDIPVLYRGEAIDHSKKCDSTAGAAYRKSFWGNRYLRYRVKGEIGLQVKEFQLMYDREAIDKWITFNETLSNGAYEIDSDWKKNRDADLKLKVFVEKRNLPGNAASALGLEQEQLQKGADIEHEDIVIDELERALKDIDREIDSLRSSNHMEISQLLPQLQAQLIKLNQELADKLAELNIIKDALDDFKRSKVPTIIQRYRMTKFMDTHIPIICNVEVLHTFFNLYEQHIKPLESEYEPKAKSHTSNWYDDVTMSVYSYCAVSPQTCTTSTDVSATSLAAPEKPIESSKRYGLRSERSIEDPGDNFFDAVFTQLKRAGIGENQEVIQKSIVQQIIDNFADYTHLLGTIEIRDFLAALREKDPKAIKVLMQALADKFEISIVLLENDKPVPTVIKPTKGNAERVIYLGLNSDSSFEPLVEDETAVDATPLPGLHERLKKPTDIPVMALASGVPPALPPRDTPSNEPIIIREMQPPPVPPRADATVNTTDSAGDETLLTVNSSDSSGRTTPVDENASPFIPGPLASSNSDAQSEDNGTDRRRSYSPTLFAHERKHDPEITSGITSRRQFIAPSEDEEEGEREKLLADIRGFRGGLLHVSDNLSVRKKNTNTWIPVPLITREGDEDADPDADKAWKDPDPLALRGCR